jgi:sporulation protein YlmC with PRC-barrel domain
MKDKTYPICMETFAKELSEKTVIDTDGAVIGELHNVTLNFKTGELQNLLVSPNGAPTDQQRHRSKYSTTDEGRYMISAELVTAVKDQIVVQ